MIYYHDTLDFALEHPCAVTLGKFDGVHLGHKKLMDKIISISGEEGIESSVFAINPAKDRLILTCEEQRELLESMGIDVLIRCPFVKEIYSLTPQDFIESILISKLHARWIVVGDDFRFGHYRAGDAFFLKEYCRDKGISVVIFEKEMYRGREISSTYIREALDDGDIALVNTLMGREYTLRGRVVHGKGLGSKMGMPTANLVPDEDKYLPRNGVYLSFTDLDGRDLPSITNVGTKPTVDGRSNGAETYIYGIERPLYDHEISVRLIEHVRDEIRFASVGELKEQIGSDIKKGREYFIGKGIMVS